MSSFDDLLAAALLYVDSWENPGEEDGISGAWEILNEEISGATRLTAWERERVFRDAAIRTAARTGEAHASIARRYGVSAATVSRLCCGAGIRRRGGAS